MKSIFQKVPGIVLLSVFALGSISSQAQILPEKIGDHYFSSTRLLEDEKYASEIESFFSKGEAGIFEGASAVAIQYYIFEQDKEERGAILISSGRTEAALKYKELIFDLYSNGYSVYILDHRGQGLSGRMTDDPEMGYVDDFQFYIDDMKKFYDDFLKRSHHDKKLLLSHSLGGAIAMSYLEQHPDDFDAAAFSSPMLGFDWYICPLTKILSGKTPKYAPGQVGYSDDSTKFDGNSVTGSKIRYYRKLAENNRVPESRLGGVSVQWLNQSCKHIRKIFRQIDKIDTPFIIFSAKNETVVNPAATEKFIRQATKLNKNCELYHIDNAQHELLMEKDQQRNEVLEAILVFWECK